jgi:hypothetical protein
MSAAMQETTYSQKEAMRKLEISKDVVVRLREAGLLPYQQAGPYIRYERQFIDELSALLRLAQLGQSTTFDVALIELYYIRHMYAQATPKQRKKLRQHCRDMVEKGKAFTLPWLIDELRHHYPESTVRKWARTGKIACVSIHRTYYLSLRYARRLVWLLTDCLVTQEAADRLQRHGKSIYSYIRKGELAAIKGPDGKLRIDPAQLSTVRNVGVPITQAAAALHISPTWLWELIHKGRVSAIAGDKELQVPLEEVEKWRTQFTTLNPGFEWLQQQLAGRRTPTPVLAANQAAAHLDTSFVTLLAWTHAGLLPYFDRSFDGAHRSRLYVKRYIDGLRRSVPGKVTKAAVRAYYLACACHRMIM